MIMIPLEFLICLKIALSINIEKAPVTNDAIIAAGIICNPKVTFKKNAKSIIGHPDLAKVIGVKYNRESIKLNFGDEALVAQYNGPRLKEGCQVLPKDAKIVYFKVIIEEV